MIVRDGTPANGNVNGGDTYTITLSTTGPNRLILVCTGNSNNLVTAATPTASGLTFTQVGNTETTQGGSSQVWQAWAGSQLSSLVITVTATPGGNSPQMTGLAIGYIGVDPSNPIDAVASTSNAGANGLSQAVTTITPKALVIGYAEENNTNTIVPGAGFALVQQTPALTFNDSGLLEATNGKPTMDPGVVTVAYTLGGAFIPDALHAIALRPASGFKSNTLRPRPFKPGLPR